MADLLPGIRSTTPLCTIFTALILNDESMNSRSVIPLSVQIVFTGASERSTS